MPVKLRHLHYFARIVETGSFSRAASTVHIAQPALSQQIAELELDLGVPLLHRGPRGARPTPAGDILYREAVSILGRVNQLSELVRANGPEIEGTVSVGASCTLAATLLGPFFEACRAALPRVILRCSVADGASLRARLEAHALDLACAFEDDLSPVFARQPMFRQACYLVRKKSQPGNRTTVSLHELKNLPLILPTAPNVVRSKLDRTFSEASFAPHVAAEADVMSTALQAVEADIGAAILCRRALARHIRLERDTNENELEQAGYSRALHGCHGGGRRRPCRRYQGNPLRRGSVLRAVRIEVAVGRTAGLRHRRGQRGLREAQGEVRVGGELVPRSLWGKVRPKPGTFIHATSYP